jgi:hypothetical protein
MVSIYEGTLYLVNDDGNIEPFVARDSQRSRAQTASAGSPAAR